MTSAMLGPGNGLNINTWGGLFKTKFALDMDGVLVCLAGLVGRLVALVVGPVFRSFGGLVGWPVCSVGWWLASLLACLVAWFLGSLVSYFLGFLGAWLLSF